MLTALGARDRAEMTQVKVHTVYVWLVDKNYKREVVSIILVWTFYLKLEKLTKKMFNLKL